MKKIEFRQRNMYCNFCFMNVLNTLLDVHGVQEMDIDMQSKIIRLQMDNGAMGKKKLQSLINAALTVGATPTVVPVH